MKRIRIFLLFWFFVFTLMTSYPGAFAQDAYYQDKNGPIPLWHYPGKIVIRIPDPGDLDMGSLLGLDPAFDPNKEPELTLFGFYYVWLIEGSNVASVVARLDTNQAVDIVNPIYTISPEDTMEFVAFDRVAVKFLDGVSRATIDSLNNYWQVEIIDSLLGVPFYLLKVTDTTESSVLEIANVYEQDSRTEFAVPDFLAQVTLDYVTADSFYNYQYYLQNTGQTGGSLDADIDAPEAWEFGLGDTSLIIAVSDLGIEAHEDLPASRLYAGHDFVGDTVFKNMPPDSDPSPGDGCVAHGMACAGIIAASHNSIGIAGIAPNCKIMPLKIFDDLGIAKTYYEFVQSIRWAQNNGASVMSNSWTIKTQGDTTRLSELLQEMRWAIKEASQEVLIFHSAGNTGNVMPFPANMREVIAVGAIDKSNNRWLYSPHYSRGDSMDLVAPTGNKSLLGDVWTVDITGNAGYNPWEICLQGGNPEASFNLNYTTRFGGTSGACPQGAGAAALLMSYGRNINWRTMALPEYRQVLKLSADDLGVPGWDSLFGYGRLNAMKALIAIARGDINKDGNLSLADITLLVNYIFDKDKPPCLGLDPVNCWTPTPHLGLADANCSGSISLGDIIYLSNYMFQNPPGWPPPPICYEYNY